MNSPTVFAGTDGLITMVLMTLARMAIGVKSSAPLNGMFSISDGFTARVLMVSISMV